MIYAIRYFTTKNKVKLLKNEIIYAKIPYLGYFYFELLTATLI